MAEYAVVLGMITIAIVTTISLLSGVVQTMFQDVVDIVALLT
jgi:Flp pilus assembly pilin Flp